MEPCHITLSENGILATVFMVADALDRDSYGLLICLDRAVIEHPSGKDFVFDFNGVKTIPRRQLALLMSRSRELRQLGSRVFGATTDQVIAFLRENGVESYFETIDSLEELAA